MSDSESPIAINEHLSALLDDEAGSFEERRILDELKSDQALSEKLASYALIGEAMRTGNSQQVPLSKGSSFLDSINKKIALEDQFDEVVVRTEFEISQEAQQSNIIKTSPSRLRPIGGFALAASVGALTFMGLQNSGFVNNPTPEPNNIVNNSAPTAIVQVAPANQSITSAELDPVQVSNNDHYIDADAYTRALLKPYVDSHMQYAVSSTFVPSVRVIAYTDNQ